MSSNIFFYEILYKHGSKMDEPCPKDISSYEKGSWERECPLYGRDKE